MRAVTLDQDAGRRFIKDWLDALPNQLDDAFREALFRQTRGNALFTKELVGSMQERGDLVGRDAGRLDRRRFPAGDESTG